MELRGWVWVNMGTGFRDRRVRMGKLGIGQVVMWPGFHSVSSM